VAVNYPKQMPPYLPKHFYEIRRCPVDGCDGDLHCNSPYGKPYHGYVGGERPTFRCQKCCIRFEITNPNSFYPGGIDLSKRPDLEKFDPNDKPPFLGAPMIAINAREAQQFFELAGFSVSALHELTNRYWPDVREYDEIRRTHPWWLAQTEFGNILLKSRKRVVEIDWSATGFKNRQRLITRDKVTHEDLCVHAYNESDLLKYLQKLREVLGEWRRTVGAIYLLWAKECDAFERSQVLRGEADASLILRQSIRRMRELTNTTKDLPQPIYSLPPGVSEPYGD
jgi:hypothetical protein